MKCAEVRKLVQVYIDSELDAKHSLEVEQHLECCLECAGLFDAEKRFDERLGRFLRKPSRTASLWRNIEAQIAPAAAPISHTSSVWWFAAAATILLCTGGFFWIKAQPFDLAKAAGECHNAYLHRLASPEFTGAPPPETEKEFAGQLDAAAFSYHPSATGFSSRGSRFCHMANVPCALTMGDYGKVPVSVIVFEEARLAQFPQARERLVSGDPVVCSRTGRFHFAMRAVDNHVVCIVADAPKSVVEDLAKSVTAKPEAIFPPTKTHNERIAPMKRKEPLLAMSAAMLLAACASVQPIALPETAGPQPARLYPREGTLKVYSATERHSDGDLAYYPHSDYRILTRDGRVFKEVRNAISPSDEIPATVTLPSGAYTVVAESETSGMVTVPVVVRTGRTTVLHLERDKDWTPPALARESDLIHLPNGQPIGFRPADR
jgi:hypothetical protein